MLLQKFGQLNSDIYQLLTFSSLVTITHDSSPSALPQRYLYELYELSVLLCNFTQGKCPSQQMTQSASKGCMIHNTQGQPPRPRTEAADGIKTNCTENWFNRSLGPPELRRRFVLVSVCTHAYKWEDSLSCFGYKQGHCRKCNSTCLYNIISTKLQHFDFTINMSGNLSKTEMWSSFR